MACGFLLLGKHLQKNYPFLISVSPITDDWTVVAYPQPAKTIQRYQIIQEKLVETFVRNWFTISANSENNNARWQGCSVDECKDAEQFNPDVTTCAISCKSNDKVFTEFTNKVLPYYQQMTAIWYPTIMITPIIVTQKTSKWQVRVDVKSSEGNNFTALVFIDVNRDIDQYPATFGYYIDQFNSYRIP